MAAAAAKQSTADAEAAELPFSPAKCTPHGKENVTPDRDQVRTLLGTATADTSSAGAVSAQSVQ